MLSGIHRVLHVPDLFSESILSFKAVGVGHHRKVRTLLETHV